jgi:hypothetical protein
MARNSRYDLGIDELVGDDILGDYDDIVGAAIQRRLAPLPGSPAGAMLRTRAPTKGREYVLGFDSVTTVAAAATAVITTRPQVVFRPDRLVIPASIAPAFLLNDLKVGKNSQFAAATAVPAEVFTQGAFGVRLKNDTAQVSMDIILNVTNISGGALRFNAALIGPAVE